jgi:hypothetical protein
MEVPLGLLAITTEFPDDEGGNLGDAMTFTVIEEFMAAVCDDNT